MPDALEIAEVIPQPASLMMVIERLASNPNVDIDKLRQLLEMQERWEINRDKSALRHAMAEFKADPPTIIKERTARMEKDGRLLYTYKYADLEDVTSAIETELGKKGITFAWPQKEDAGGIHITCIMRYGMYEEAGVAMAAPPDTTGGKNAIQAKASTVTYLRRYTLLGAVGMAAGMPDNDGNGPPGSAMTAEVIKGWVEKIEKCTGLVDLQKLFQDAYKAAGDDRNVGGQFISARDKRKAELKAEPQPGPTPVNKPLVVGRIADPIALERLEWIKNSKDHAELTRVYNNAIKMANQSGDKEFADNLTVAANKRAEAIRAGN